ncbi:MAG TPA: nuclear transport factor 2 family protein [Candidatus Binatia bacterium]|nr:nuclear transport factor 2 family protein [Candidatus Binatia bacterium]
MSRRMRGGPAVLALVTVAGLAGLIAAMILSGCGRKSETRSTENAPLQITDSLAGRPGAPGVSERAPGSPGIPTDLDSLAFRPKLEQVRADIDSGNAQYIQAWKVGSADLFANVFAKEGTLMRRDGKLLQGRERITSVMGNVFSKIRMRQGSIITRTLRVEGDRAYETGTYRFETVPVRGGPSSIDSGQFVQVWKYESGQWKMWRNDARPRG